MPFRGRSSQNMTGGLARTTGSFYYTRHFILLAAVGVLILRFRDWLAPLSLRESFAVYGALHASMLMLTLRRDRAWGRRALFIAAGACLSLSSVELAAIAGRHGIARFGEAWPLLSIGMASGAGAASYAVLLRVFWIHDLSWSSIVYLTLCCALVTPGLGFGRSGIVPPSAALLVVAWWCTFSIALWFRDASARDIKGRHARDS